MRMVNPKCRLLNKTPPEHSGGVSGPKPEIKEERKEESRLFAQIQEFLRIHGFIVMGNAEVDMAAQS